MCWPCDINSNRPRRKKGTRRSSQSSEVQVGMSFWISSNLPNSPYLQTSLKPEHKVASIYTCGPKGPVHASVVRESSSESSTLPAVETSTPFSPLPSSEVGASLRTPVPSSLVVVSPCWDGAWEDGWSACTPAGRKGGPSSSLSS
jgi:hypothetical protein